MHFLLVNVVMAAISHPCHDAWKKVVVENYGYIIQGKFEKRLKTCILLLT